MIAEKGVEELIDQCVGTDDLTPNDVVSDEPLRALVLLDFAIVQAQPSEDIVQFPYQVSPCWA